MLSPGDRIDSWIIERPLGEGGMGAVYLAHSVMSDRLRAALKVLKPSGLSDGRERFVREVEALVSLKHPSLVRVLGWGEAGADLYMAMELLDGEDLGERIARGPLPEAEALRALRKVADGLRHAHERGIFHRDIKPSNIMIDADGTAVLIDFGIAVELGRSRLTQSGLVPGTMAYLPPEAFQQDQLQPALGDVYALGQVLYETLTGQALFQGDPDSVAGQALAQLMGQKLCSAPLDPGPGFSEQLRATLRRATEPDPSRRTPDMRTFAIELGVQITDPSAVLTSRVSGPAQPARSVQRAPTTSSLRTGGMVVAAGGVGLFGVVLAAATLAGVAMMLSLNSGRASGPDAPEPGQAPVPISQDAETQDTAPPTALPPALEPLTESVVSASPTPSRPRRQSTATRTVQPSAARVPSPIEPSGIAGASEGTAPPPSQTISQNLRTYPITFTSVPLGAQVWVDGELVGRTPLLGIDLSSGDHTVRLASERDSIERTVKVGRQTTTRYLWRGDEQWEAGY